jgi:serine/threonine protein kinase
MARCDSTGTGFDELLHEMAREPALLVPGTSLADGRFVLRRLLGAGGMGVVYEAHDSLRGQPVAVKALARTDHSAIVRIKREFRSLADVVHPNLVGLHRLYCDADRWFFAMDLVEGQPLVGERPWDPGSAGLRNAFRQLADGIQAIHQAGKLHRDLKPSNVMLTPQGRVVVLDFGLVSEQIAGRDVGQPEEGGLSGTPAYVAPEQVCGAPATSAADWYAFGTMLYEALCGRRPFEGATRSVLARKCEEDAPPPSRYRSGIPRNLERLCLGLLERDPERRPGIEAIRRGLGAKQETGEEAAPEESWPFVGRRRELRRLARAQEATRAGRSAVVLVRGVSGVGKTALVRRFLADLERRRHAVVISSRCFEREVVPNGACDELVEIGRASCRERV